MSNIPVYISDEDIISLKKEIRILIAKGRKHYKKNNCLVCRRRIDYLLIILKQLKILQREEK